MAACNEKMSLLVTTWRRVDRQLMRMSEGLAGMVQPHAHIRISACLPPACLPTSSGDVHHPCVHNFGTSAVYTCPQLPTRPQGKSESHTVALQVDSAF